MNEVRRITPGRHDLERIETIVSRHLPPDLISGFSVEFGGFDDEPAMFITFQTSGPRPDFKDRAGRQARAERLRSVKDAIHADLLQAFEDRYPFYSFADGVSA